MISSTSLGSVFMVVEGNRDMGRLVADIVFILNWLNSRWSYFGFQLGVSKFSPERRCKTSFLSVVLFPFKDDPQGS